MNFIASDLEIKGLPLLASLSPSKAIVYRLSLFIVPLHFSNVMSMSPISKQGQT